MYPNEVGRMQTELRNTLGTGNNVDIRTHYYQVLDESQAECTRQEWQQWNDEAVGHILFEYDPTMAAPQNNWRLMVHATEVDTGRVN